MILGVPLFSETSTYPWLGYKPYLFVEAYIPPFRIAQKLMFWGYPHFWKHLAGGWATHFEKYMLVKLDPFPQVGRDEHFKKMKPPARFSFHGKAQVVFFDFLFYISFSLGGCLFVVFGWMACCFWKKSFDREPLGMKSTQYIVLSHSIKSMRLWFCQVDPPKYSTT